MYDVLQWETSSYNRQQVLVKLCLFMCLLLSTAGGAVVGQSGNFAAIRSSFDQFRSNTLQEKLFLHLDRPAYASGETMWFKLYNLDGTQHQPLDMSKVAYVEVLDETKRPVLQGKFALKAGTGKGSFVLPPTLGSGNYTVRAYTNWMKNFSPDFYFEQPVTIINTFKNAGLKPAKEAAAYDIQFFPEGGNLVDGLTCKVAFKGTDSKSGKGIACQGEIVDQEGNVVAQFEPLKFGIGHFTFTPSRASKYTAKITLPNQQVLTRQLPAIQEQGYTVQVEEKGAAEVMVTVAAKGLQSEQVYLLGHARQQIGVAEAGTLQNGKATFVFRKAALADGINHLTVFNSRQKPVCERLYFKRPAARLEIAATTDKNSYGTRQKVTIDMTTAATTGAAVPADLSLAVYRLDALQGPVATDIASYLWLTSDLKGTIEQPEYYLTATGTVADQALDNLMLTHGWSRFRWQEVLRNRPQVFEYQPEVNGHLVRSKVTHAATGTPAQGITTYLAAPGKHVRFYQGTSAANGMVQHEVKDFYGYKEIILQTNTTKDSTYHFRVFSPFSEKFAATKLPELALAKSLQPEVAQRHLEVQVQNAYFETYRDVFYSPGIDSTAFYGKPDDRYLLDDYIRFKTMEEVLHEYVTPVQARKRKGGYHLMVLDRPNRGIFSDNPLVLLDGVPVFDMNRVMAIDPLKVKQLEVVTQKYFVGPRTYSGIVSFTTYKGDLGSLQLDPRSLLLEYEGLQLEREFYAPAYATPEQLQSRLPDFRNLLHWVPDVKTKADGKGNVAFYTSDQAGKYLVVVQGITEKGLAGSKTFTFEVKQPL